MENIPSKGLNQTDQSNSQQLPDISSISDKESGLWMPKLPSTSENEVTIINPPQVYIIYSRWSLSQLDNFLKDYGDVGFLRIIYDNTGKETDRTIAIITQQVYKSLCNSGYGVSSQGSRSYGKGFKIMPFSMKENNFPGLGRTKTIFVPVPKYFENDDSRVIVAVDDKLKHLAEWDIIPDKSWIVNVPLKSREKGGVNGGCFISFNQEVPIEQIATVRILLTDTYWPEHAENSDVSGHAIVKTKRQLPNMNLRPKIPHQLSTL